MIVRSNNVLIYAINYMHGVFFQYTVSILILICYNFLSKNETGTCMEDTPNKQTNVCNC